MRTITKKLPTWSQPHGNSSVLRDQRDELVKQLSTLADVKVTDDGSSGYTVSMANGQPLVSGKVAGQLSAGQDANGNSTLTLKFSTSEFTLNPSAGGQLGALYDYESRHPPTDERFGARDGGIGGKTV